MKKIWLKFKRPLFWSVCIFFLGGFGSLFVQKYLAPYLASKPIFSSFGFLRIDSPIVITKTEQIRVNENIRLVDLVKELTPKTVLILVGRGDLQSGFEESTRGSGIIVSSDGIIATDGSLLADNRNNYLVVTAQGKVLPAVFLANDPKTNLSLLKVENGDFSVVNFGQSRELELGQQLVVLSGSEANNLSHLRITFVAQAPSDVSTSSIYSSEIYRQNFGIGEQPAIGAGIFNLSAQLVGLSTKTGIIPAEAVRSAVDSYFAHKIIERPYLGLNYSIITPAGSKTLNLAAESGIMLRSVAGQPVVISGSPAAVAGLRSGDIILKINDQEVNLSQSLDFYLNNAKAGEEWRLRVMRGEGQTEIKVTLGKLK